MLEEDLLVEKLITIFDEASHHGLVLLLCKDQVLRLCLLVANSLQEAGHVRLLLGQVVCEVLLEVIDVALLGTSVSLDQSLLELAKDGIVRGAEGADVLIRAAQSNLLTDDREVGASLNCLRGLVLNEVGGSLAGHAMVATFLALVGVLLDSVHDVGLDVLGDAVVRLTNGSGRASATRLVVVDLRDRVHSICSGSAAVASTSAVADLHLSRETLLLLARRHLHVIVS